MNYSGGVGMKKILKVPKWPIADEKEELQIKEVLQTESWWRNQGTQVKKFEKEFAQYQGCKAGISVANGTQAIEIALKALNIGEGDEVIVPDFTFFSTVSAVLSVKAIPVIVDVKDDTYCIDPEQIERAITEKTKAIIPVHIAGSIANMHEINRIAERHNLFIIEDASHAHGSFLRNKGAGSFGTLSTFSFQNAKLMTAGEGGIILGQDEKIMEKVFLESNCGRSEYDTTYQHTLIGTNSRLSEIQGAILRVQLSRLSSQVALREKNYKHLEACLYDVSGIKLQKLNDEMSINSHYMVMFYYEKEEFQGAERSEFIQYLKEAGIPCNRSYESLHKLPVFKTLSADRWRMVSNEVRDGEKYCKNSERISDEVVCLNHNVLLGDKKLVENIVNIIKSFKKTNRKDCDICHRCIYETVKH